ncbi:MULTISPECIES: toprim domain-containing protein [Streptomyces]|uniref:hypothetical protein n=1 Tax=Streptomyces TaxID=1883 RepID=UPI0020C0E222|nr:hypothetical protein [Streptomyces sp. 43Y-GA-1]MCL6286740.1 hypothetical protein [Streptomyces sp. 43Y-GA-1]
MDAELRADGLGTDRGILVVEGPDDKRVFARHVFDASQILPAGGRKILLSAHEKATQAQRAKIIFVTDCDYEVRRGNLRGAPDLVITTFTDMESDLIDLGLVELAVLDLVPGALDSSAACKRISEALLSKARKMALPLGRIRMAAQPLGIPIHLDDVKMPRYWDNKDQSINSQKLTDAMHSKVSEVVGFQEWRELVEKSPADPGMCHGKDLARNLASLLKSDHRVDGITADRLVQMMRAHLDNEHLSRWDVVSRIRGWQKLHHRFVLSS